MPPPRPRRVVEPGSRLFVGNLSYEIDTDQLRKFFEKWGPVNDCFLPQDRTTGKPRGFGFVTFRDAADAKLAVAQADGTELDGRQLRVNVAEDTRGPPQSHNPHNEQVSGARRPKMTRTTSGSGATRPTRTPRSRTLGCPEL